jgi:hypothetical protein
MDLYPLTSTKIIHLKNGLFTYGIPYAFSTEQTSTFHFLAGLLYRTSTGTIRSLKTLSTAYHQRMTDDTEFTGPGSVSKVFEWHLKQELDASGTKPIIIKAISPKPKKAR